MNERKRFYFLMLIMISVSLVVGGIAISLLYRAAIDEQRDRLMEIAQTQARLIEAVARFDAARSDDFPQDSSATTISQIVDAHDHNIGFGKTGEFTLARREGEQIIFLLSHRHSDLENPNPIPWDSQLAEPLRQALSGKSGTIIALDYRGETVLAAYEPVAELNIGIVAKIDLAEVRVPFVRAGLFAFGSAVVVVFFASLLFLRISNPMIRRVEELYEKAQEELAERKRTEEILQQERDLNSAILETTSALMVVLDPDGRIIHFNRACEQKTGYVFNEVQGKHVWDVLLIPEEIETVKGVFADLRAGDFPNTHENDWVAKNGNHRMITWSNTTILDKSGEVQYIIGTGIDVTDFKLTEQALHESERHMRLAFDAADLGSWDWDLQTGSVVFDAPMAKFFGLTARKTTLDIEATFKLLHPDDEPHLRHQIEDARLALGSYHDEFRVCTPDGQTRWLGVRGQFLCDDDGKPSRVISVCFDISKRKQVELSLRQADRLSAIGTLAAGLGHDMNNVLLPVRARLDLIEQTDLPAKAREQFIEIRKSAKYLQDLADGLHLLALDPNDMDASTETTDLNEWWRQTHTLLARALPKHVRFSASLPSDLPTICIAPHRLTQAVLNMLVNSGTAVDESGRVQLWANADMDKQAVRIGLVDNGCGMTEKVKRRAFEPFFTTKSRGLGTGLGLSLVHGVVQAAGGTVDIDSEPGKGTTIVLTLPFAKQRSKDKSSGDAEAVPHALVSVHDKRIESLVISLLEMGGFDVKMSNPKEGCRDAFLWITDAPNGTLETVRACIKRNCHVIILGPAAGEWNEPGILVIDNPNDFDKLRAAISHAAEGVPL